MRLAICLLIVLYVMFVTIPGIVLFFLCFRRRKEDLFSFLEEKRIPFRDFSERIDEAYSSLADRGIREVSIVSDDGKALKGYLIDQGMKDLFIFFHGFNHSSVEDVLPLSAKLASIGYSILFVSERGHGESEGHLLSLGLLESRDVLSWIDWAESNGARSIYLYGISMGASALAYASDSFPPSVRATVLDAPFVSPYLQMVQECRKRHAPWRIVIPYFIALGKLFFHDDIRRRTTDSLMRSDGSFMFIHGERDDTVYKETFSKVYESCSSDDKRLLVIEDGEHSNSLLKGGAEAEDAVIGFYEEHRLGRNK